MTVEAVERLRRPTDDVPVVLARVEGGRGLVDLRCVPPERDVDVERALRAAMGGSAAHHGTGAEPPSS